MIDQSQARNLIGQQLRNREGDKIGKIGKIYVDDYRGQPEWLTVNTGLFGTRESFVPLAEAVLEGADLVVPYTKIQIKDAPNIDDSSHLTEAEEQELYAFYGIPYTTEGSTFADMTRSSGAPNAAQTPALATITPRPAKPIPKRRLRRLGIPPMPETRMPTLRMRTAPGTTRPAQSRTGRSLTGR